MYKVRQRVTDRLDAQRKETHKDDGLSAEEVRAELAKREAKKELEEKQRKQVEIAALMIQRSVRMLIARNTVRKKRDAINRGIDARKARTSKMLMSWEEVDEEERKAEVRRRVSYMNATRSKENFFTPGLVKVNESRFDGAEEKPAFDCESDGGLGDAAEDSGLADAAEQKALISIQKNSRRYLAKKEATEMRKKRDSALAAEECRTEGRQAAIQSKYRKAAPTAPTDCNEQKADQIGAKTEEFKKQRHKAEAEKRATVKAATLISKNARRFLAKKEVARMRQEKAEEMKEDQDMKAQQTRGLPTELRRRAAERCKVRQEREAREQAYAAAKERDKQQASRSQLGMALEPPEAVSPKAMRKALKALRKEHAALVIQAAQRRHAAEREAARRREIRYRQVALQEDEAKKTSSWDADRMGRFHESEVGFHESEVGFHESEVRQDNVTLSRQDNVYARAPAPPIQSIMAALNPAPIEPRHAPAPPPAAPSPRKSPRRQRPPAVVARAPMPVQAPPAAMQALVSSCRPHPSASSLAGPRQELKPIKGRHGDPSAMETGSLSPKKLADQNLAAAGGLSPPMRQWALRRMFSPRLEYGNRCIVTKVTGRAPVRPQIWRPEDAGGWRNPQGEEGAVGMDGGSGNHGMVTKAWLNRLS
eukprot:gnl/TRDRNA2_/TRDRNA2_83495_c0_seq1.p1 gnl/TRDRNA2_/TRDRNA2_83495_c0~~gnl/TRDRNA2_/TRDRNA2_83495_c0_seq1.p1  ORF type:complete len:650 (-),score=146.94 gnl/TRDRNA2_/TRDRNA2_83495_c0_seq1:34-1983(-)